MTAIDPNEFPRRVVKGGSKIVDHITIDEREGKPQVLIEANIGDEGVGIGVSIKGKLVRIFLDEEGEGRFQFLDVMFGPFDL